MPSLVQPGSAVGLRQRLMLVAHICSTQAIADDLETLIVQVHKCSPSTDSDLFAY